MENLTLKQQFELKKFEAKILQLSTEELKYLLLDHCRQLMIQENYYKDLIKHKWGL